MLSSLSLPSSSSTAQLFEKYLCLDWKDVIFSSFLSWDEFFFLWKAFLCVA